MTDFNELIPELKAWKTDIGSWISAVGRYDHAIAYGCIFWPEFKLHKDCVLFADCSVSAFDQWMEHTAVETKSVEGVLNHRHILDLFPRSEFEPTRETVIHLGRLLKDMWSCKLARDFPSRSIVVDFDDSYFEDLLNYQITFYHQANP